MERIRELQSQLSVLYEEETKHRLSERTVVDIILKLVNRGDLSIVYTLDGKEFLTLNQLENEIRNEVYHQKRLDVVDLQPLLNVDMSMIEPAIERILQKYHNLHLVEGELLSSSYLEGVADEISIYLNEHGKVSVDELVHKYSFPKSFLLEVFLKNELALGNGRINAVLEEGILYTPSLKHQYRSSIRGAFRGVSRPVPCEHIRTRLKLEKKLFYSIFQELLGDSLLNGSTGTNSSIISSNSVFRPKGYDVALNNWIVSFVQGNGYIAYSLLTKLKISNPREYIENHFSEKGVAFNNIFVGNGIVEVLKEVLEELKLWRWWFDMSSVCAFSLSVEDLKKLVYQASKLTVVMFSDNGETGDGSCVLESNDKKENYDDDVARRRKGNRKKEKKGKGRGGKKKNRATARTIVTKNKSVAENEMVLLGETLLLSSGFIEDISNFYKIFAEDVVSKIKLIVATEKERKKKIRELSDTDENGSNDSTAAEENGDEVAEINFLESFDELASSEKFIDHMVEFHTQPSETKKDGINGQLELHYCDSMHLGDRGDEHMRRVCYELAINFQEKEIESLRNEYRKTVTVVDAIHFHNEETNNGVNNVLQSAPSISEPDPMLNCRTHRNKLRNLFRALEVKQLNIQLFGEGLGDIPCDMSQPLASYLLSSLGKDIVDEMMEYIFLTDFYSSSPEIILNIQAKKLLNSPEGSVADSLDDEERKKLLKALPPQLKIYFKKMEIVRERNNVNSFVEILEEVSDKCGFPFKSLSAKHTRTLLFSHKKESSAILNDLKKNETTITELEIILLFFGVLFIRIFKRALYVPMNEESVNLLVNLVKPAVVESVHDDLESIINREEDLIELVQKVIDMTDDELLLPKVE